jgi:hypothetical protein
MHGLLFQASQQHVEPIKFCISICGDWGMDWDMDGVMAWVVDASCR